jgi:hypothetical protein
MPNCGPGLWDTGVAQVRRTTPAPASSPSALGLGLLDQPRDGFRQEIGAALISTVMMASIVSATRPKVALRVELRRDLRACRSGSASQEMTGGRPNASSATPRANGPDSR